MKKTACILLSLLLLCGLSAIVSAADTAAEVLVLSVPDVEAIPGQTVNVDILVTSNPGFDGLVLSVDYDPAVMRLTSHTDGGLFNGLSSVSEYHSDRPFRIVFAGAEDTTGTGRLIRLTFYVSPDVPFADYSVSVSILDCINSADQKPQTAAENGVVSVVEKLSAADSSQFSFEIVDGEAVLTSYLGTDETVVIPSVYTLNGVEYPVTRIGDEAFAYSETLKSIHIPESVTAIGDYAFDCCMELTEIIVDGTPILGERAMGLYSIGRKVYAVPGFSVTAPCSASGIAEYVNTWASVAELKWLLTHIPGESVQENVTAPTCTEQGSCDSVTLCASCGIEMERRPEVLPASHELVVYPEKKPTCTEPGWDAYKACTRCDYSEKVELPATGHSYENGVCTVCGDVLYRINAAEVALGTDLSMNYYVTLADGYTNAQMRFTMHDETVTVSGAFDETFEMYVYTFSGITPQAMGDNIRAELVLDETLLCVKDDYSVLQNCKNLLSRTADELGISEEKYDAMRTLIADLMEYGSAAQVYRNYRTDSMLNSDADIAALEPSAFISLPEEKSSRMTVLAESDTAFVGAGVMFDYVNSLYVRFTADNIADVTVSVKGGKVYDSADFIENNGTFILFLEPMPAALMSVCESEDIELCKGGEPVQMLTYSLASYVFTMQDKETKMANLAKAVYNYGLSADIYARAQ